MSDDLPTPSDLIPPAPIMAPPPADPNAEEGVATRAVPADAPTLVQTPDPVVTPAEEVEAAATEPVPAPADAPVAGADNPPSEVSPPS